MTMKRNHLMLLCFLMPYFVMAQHSQASLGINSRHLSESRAENRNLTPPYGSYVYKVYDNSAAENLDLQVFDYVYQIDNWTVNDTLSLTNILNKYQPGDEVKVTYLRKGTVQSGTVKLSNRNEIERVHLPASKDPFLGVQAVHEKLDKGVKGVPVNVVPNSTAWAMGLEKGDVITKVDDYPVVSWDDLGAGIDDREVGDFIELEVYRDGEYLSFNRPIKSRAATHNDHSRGHNTNPPVVQAEDPSAPTSKATLAPMETQEVETLEKKADMEMPRISDLEVTKLNVFPNPSTGIFDINFNLPIEGRTAIRIFSPTGQVIYENNLGNFTGTFSDRIDIANNAKGIYFLAITQNDQAITRKVVLQ